MNIYFISIRLDSISTPLSSNHPNKSRHVLKKIGLETAKGGQFLLGPFYLFTTRCLILCCPPLPQAVSVSFTSTVPIHFAPPPCQRAVLQQTFSLCLGWYRGVREESGTFTIPAVWWLTSDFCFYFTYRITSFCCKSGLYGNQLHIGLTELPQTHWWWVLDHSGGGAGEMGILTIASTTSYTLCARPIQVEHHLTSQAVEYSIKCIEKSHLPKISDTTRELLSGSLSFFVPIARITDVVRIEILWGVK